MDMADIFECNDNNTIVPYWNQIINILYHLWKKNIELDCLCSFVFIIIVIRLC